MYEAVAFISYGGLHWELLQQKHCQNAWGQQSIKHALWGIWNDFDYITTVTFYYSQQFRIS